MSLAICSNLEMDISEIWLSNFKDVVSQEIANHRGKAADGYRAVAAKTGIGYDYIYQMYTGKSGKQPTVEVMNSIAKAYASGRGSEWVHLAPQEPLYRKGVVVALNADGQSKAINLTDNPEYPAIRRVAIKAQAGVSGYAVEYMNDDGQPIVFRRDWYTMHNYQPDKMLALRVGGESMVPNLYPGDLIVTNSAQTEPKDGIAFVVAYEGEVVVKRLIRDAGQWWLSSDNQDQRRYPRKVCNGDTQIIGEVVYRQTERI